MWDEVNGARDLSNVLIASGLNLDGLTVVSANGISADGLTIVGEAINRQGQYEAYIATIPEPATLPLLVCLGALLRRSRRRTSLFLSKQFECWSPFCRQAARISAASVVVLLTGARSWSASITNLGVLPGGKASHAAGISVDGSTVAGTSGSSGGERGFRWTAAGGMQNLGVLPDQSSSHGTAISGDGSTIVGDSGDNAFHWTVAGGMELIGKAAPGATWRATGINGDGGTIALTYDRIGSTDHAYRWTPAGGLQPLRAQSVDSFGRELEDSETSAVSENGVITGWSRAGCTTHAFRWSAAHGMADLGGSDDPKFGYCISADGSVIVGDEWTDFYGPWEFQFDHVFRWTASTGIQYLPEEAMWSSAMSGDGSIVAGTSNGWPLSGEPFIWSQDIGMVALSTYLQSAGVDLKGWTFGYGDVDAITGMNFDGSVIVGNGYYNGKPRAWVAMVPEPGVGGSMLVAMSLLRRRLATRKIARSVADAGSLRTAKVLINGCVALSFISCNAARAQWVTWNTADGGNGHQYQAVAGTPFLTWAMADELAQAQGGYLATLTSSAENDFIFRLIDAPQFWNDSINGSGPAIGGFQADGSPEPGDGWRWATDEPWVYTNWLPGEPDNGAGGLFEDRLHFFSGFQIGIRANTWNDIGRDDANLGGYVVERVPEPGTLALLGLGVLFSDRRPGVFQHRLRANLSRRRRARRVIVLQHP
jgi:probable HAF family extracellular repeat protein